MKGRTTVYRRHTSKQKLEQCNPKNLQLEQDFLDYLASVDRSPTTIASYKSDLEIFWCWCLENNDNKYFVDLTKREIIKFQSNAINEWGWSPSRTRRVKAVLSSLSNYIENILDEEIPDFRPIVKKIENPAKEAVREKTILTEEQLDYLLNTLVERKKYEAACAVALAAYSGARKSELARFKTEYFTDDNIIFGAMWRTSEKIRTKGRGGRLGKRVHKYVLIKFKRYLDLWLAERERLGINSEWLLISRESDGWVPIKLSTLKYYADECSKILGVPFYFHSLRHALTTRMVSEYNLPAYIIREFFGWSNMQMIDVYCDANAMNDFGKYFGADGIIESK